MIFFDLPPFFVEIQERFTGQTRVLSQQKSYASGFVCLVFEDLLGQKNREIQVF